MEPRTMKMPEDGKDFISYDQSKYEYKMAYSIYFDTEPALVDVNDASKSGKQT